MNETGAFFYSPSPRSPSIGLDKRNEVKLGMDTTGRYFQNPKVVGSATGPGRDYHHMKYQNTKITAPPSSSSIWNMMIHNRVNPIISTGNNLISSSSSKHVFVEACPGAPPMKAPKKDFVDLMDEQLKQLTKDLLQQRQVVDRNQYQPQQQQQSQMNEIFSFLDAQDRSDMGIEEHLAGPVYFTGNETVHGTSSAKAKSHQKSSSPPKRDGFLPAAINSIRTLVGNVFRLPSLIMNSTWIDSNENSPQHFCHSDSDRSTPEHLFFDVDDIDFTPDFPVQRFDDAIACDHSGNVLEDDFVEESFVDVSPDNNLSANAPSAPNQQQQSLSEQTEAFVKVNSGETGETVVALDNSGAPSSAALTPKVPETGRNNASEPCKQTPPPTSTAIEAKLSSPVDIVKVNGTAPCTRRFVSTPEQECSRMAVVRPRKRQVPVIKTALVTRSTPIAVKSQHQNRASSRPVFFGGHHSKRTLNKNRKEKRRHEIATNIHEDFDLDSDDSSSSSGTQPCVFTDSIDDNLLPPTARNPMQPSCLTEYFGESSMNSSTGSLGGGRSVSTRRNSANFLAASYDKEFPVTLGKRAAKTEEDEGNNKEVNLQVVQKKNGAVFFEIPNSPQRRRVLVAPPKMVVKQKPRTNSVVSSSVGSSPATSSFEAGGKFWGVSPRRQRTVSEGSEDDLIEFLPESGCTDYLADVFSDTDEDEDYSSDEEGTESEEDDDEEGEEEEGEEDEDEDEDGVWPREKQQAADSDLPDSGVEEKKVRFGAKPQVRTLCTWDYAHRQARKGHWEEVGRDRVRFADRIRRVEGQLKPVLGAQHRDKVFRERFASETCSSSSPPSR